MSAPGDIHTMHGKDDAQSGISGSSGSVRQKLWRSVADLQNMVFPPTNWVIKGILPEGLTLVAGRPKVGKSWMGLDWLLAIAVGGTTLGVQCEQGDVLYAALEDTPRRLQQRMRMLAADGSWPERFSYLTTLPRADEGGIQIVRNWIEEQRKPRLVVIDVLAQVRPVKSGDEGNYDADYAAVSAWKALADEFNIAIVLVHHVRKRTASDPLEMLSGTNGLGGAADSTVILNRDSQGCTLYGRGRDLEEFEWAVTFNKTTCRWEKLGEASEVRRSDERSLILNALAEAAAHMRPKDVAAATGQNPGAVRTLLGKMVKAGEVVMLKRGTYTIPGHNDHKITTEEDEAGE